MGLECQFGHWVSTRFAIAVLGPRPRGRSAETVGWAALSDGEGRVLRSHGSSQAAAPLNRPLHAASPRRSWEPLGRLTVNDLLSPWKGSCISDIARPQNLYSNSVNDFSL